MDKLGLIKVSRFVNEGKAKKKIPVAGGRRVGIPISTIKTGLGCKALPGSLTSLLQYYI